MIAPDGIGRGTRRHGRRLRSPLSQVGIYLVVGILIVLTFVPLYIMLSMSVRSNGQIFLNFWGLPDPWLLSNFANSFHTTIHYAVNSTLGDG